MCLLCVIYVIWAKFITKLTQQTLVKKRFFLMFLLAS